MGDENPGHWLSVLYPLNSKGFVWCPQRDSNPRFPPFPVKRCRINELAFSHVSLEQGAENLSLETHMAGQGALSVSRGDDGALVLPLVL